MKARLAKLLSIGVLAALATLLWQDQSKVTAASEPSEPSSLFTGMTPGETLDELVGILGAYEHARQVRAMAPRPEGTFQTFNVMDYGAKCDGATDDRVAIQATITAACAVPGSIVYTEPSTNGCIMSALSSSGTSLTLPCGNITIKGVRGKSRWKHKAALTPVPAEMLFVQQQDLVTIDGMTFDGNWGNAATTIAEASNNQVLTGTYTLNVVSTAGFPASGVINVTSTNGNQTVTCTSSTPTTFAGCTGGSGTVMRDYAVGYVDGVSGINQTTQADPQNLLVMLRGSTNITIKNSIFQQAYGDGVWMGNSVANHAAFTTNVKILDNTFYMMARIGVTFGNPAINVLIEGNNCLYAHQECIDAEPQTFPDRNVVVRGNNLTGWWDPSQAPLVVLNIRQGGGGGELWGSTQSSWKIEHNIFNGPVGMNGVYNASFTDNTVLVDAPGSKSFTPTALQFAPLQITFGGGDITVTGNYVFTRAPGDGIDGDANNAGIAIANEDLGSDGSGNAQIEDPVRVRVSNNTVDAQNGKDGIYLVAPGGNITNFTGTASAVTVSSITDTTSTYVTNQFVDQIIQIGSASAAIKQNTSCNPGTCSITLRLVNNSTTTVWQTPTGEYAPTPAPGPYTIYRTTGDIDVSDNSISLKNGGYGSGRYGVYLTHANGIPAGRVRIHDNTIRDANGDGIHIAFGAGNVYPLVDIFRNYGFDDQATPTMTNLIAFVNPPSVTSWILSDNIAGESGTSGNLINEVAGLTSGTWLRHAGNPAEWAGFGSPNGVVAAPVGSTYHQVDGAATIMWVKQTGTGSSGWVVKALQNTAPTFTAMTLRAQLLNPATSGLAVNNGTLGTGSTNWFGNITGVGATTTTLTLAGGGFATRGWCRAWPNTSTAIETIAVANSLTAPTFSCLSALTGAPANCVDFTYECAGQ